MTKREGFLDKVYDLDDADKTQALYHDWATSYDEEMRVSGYASPGRAAAAMAAQVADITAPLLDLGCGTGLAGQAFRDAGFTTIDGTDFSEEMLAVARRKGLYRKITLGDLNDPIPARSGDYDNIAAVGVFSPGHAPAEMIDLVFGLLPVGGCFGFSLNDHALEERVTKAASETLRPMARWKSLSRSTASTCRGSISSRRSTCCVSSEPRGIRVLLLRQLVEGLQGLSAIDVGGATAHVDGDTNRLQDLLPRRAVANGRCRVKPYAAVAAPGNTYGQRDQLLRLGRQGTRRSRSPREGGEGFCQFRRHLAVAADRFG